MEQLALCPGVVKGAAWLKGEPKGSGLPFFRSLFPLCFLALFRGRTFGPSAPQAPQYFVRARILVEFLAFALDETFVPLVFVCSRPPLRVAP